VDYLFVWINSKQNKNGKKSIIKTQMEKDSTLVWGKHKNGKNQLQQKKNKYQTTREKLQKQGKNYKKHTKRRPLRTRVLIWWVISFICGERKE